MFVLQAKWLDLSPARCLLSVSSPRPQTFCPGLFSQMHNICAPYTHVYIKIVFLQGLGLYQAARCSGSMWAAGQSVVASPLIVAAGIAPDVDSMLLIHSV